MTEHTETVKINKAEAHPERKSVCGFPNRCSTGVVT